MIVCNHVIGRHTFTSMGNKDVIRVRFHLQRGKHYKTWQIKKQQHVEYYSPDKYVLKIKKGTLKNSPSVAKKIYDGANKTVCAWVECKYVEVLRKDEHDFESNSHLENIRYNPKLSVNWQNSNNENIDNQFFHSIVSDGRNLYAEIKDTP